MNQSKGDNGRGGGFRRQWALLKLLKAGGGTVSELAAKLNVHNKTIRRDINVLQEVGIPVYNKDEDLEGENRFYGGTWRLVDRRII